MQQLKTLGLIVAVFSFIFLLNIELAIGLFDANLRSIEMINKNDTSFMDATSLRVRKINRTQHVLLGTIDFNVDVDNEYTFVTYSYKKSGNEFKKLPYKLGPFPFCIYLDDETFFFDKLRSVSDFPVKGTCPFPKGRYTIQGFHMNLENIPNVISTGEYKLECNFILNGKLASGLIILVEVVSI